MFVLYIIRRGCQGKIKYFVGVTVYNSVEKMGEVEETGGGGLILAKLI